MGDSGKPGAATLDRLEAIVTSKEEIVEVEDRSIRVIKWNLTQSLRLSTTLGKMIRDVFAGLPIEAIKDKDTSDFFARLLNADIASLAEGQHDNILTLISETVVRGNFDTLDEARKWTEDIGVEALEILAVIARQNIRPLVRAIKNVLASVRSASAGPRASRSRT